MTTIKRGKYKGRKITAKLLTEIFEVGGFSGEYHYNGKITKFGDKVMDE